MKPQRSLALGGVARPPVPSQPLGQGLAPASQQVVASSQEAFQPASEAFQPASDVFQQSETFQPTDDVFRRPSDIFQRPSDVFQRPSEVFPDGRESLLEPRESLAWVADLPRHSIGFREIQGRMTDSDKRNLDEDDTDSFEAIELRMKTPMKKKMRSRIVLGLPSDEDKRDAEEEMSDAEEGRLPQPEDQATEQPEEDVHGEATTDEDDENKENHPMEVANAVNEEYKPIEVSGARQGGGEGTPLRKSVSLGCLREGEGGEVALLCRATSHLELAQGEEVAMSGLVATDQVEEVLWELANSEKELMKLRGEQDALATRTEEVLAGVLRRRERFKQLWGVSPLRINTLRTVILPRVRVVEQVVEEREEREEVLEDSVVTNIEEEDEVTGVVPLPATPCGRKVRFNSGRNETRAVSPAAATPARASLGNQSFAALKTSFAFLATPQRAAAGTPRARTPGSLRAEPTPVALRRLGARVRGEMERLYADSEEEEETGGPPPGMLRF